METRANYIIVGLFTLAAIAGAFLMVWWMGLYGGNDGRVPVEIRVRGSVAGLSVGSPVRFNGITVGSVSGLRLSDDPDFVRVMVRVEPTIPLRADTRASIGTQGLSGGAFVALQGGTSRAPALLANQTPESPAVSLEGDPSAINDLIARANTIANRVDDVAKSVQVLVATNERTIETTLKNFETFSASLANNSENISKFLDSAGKVAATLDRVAVQLDGTIKQADAIAKAVDPAAVRKTIENVRDFTTTLADERAQIRAAIRSTNETADQLRQFSTGLNSSLKDVDALVGRARSVVDAVEPESVSRTVKAIDQAAQRMNGLLAAVDETKVRQTLDDAAATTAQARKIAEGVNPETVRSLIDDVAAASKSVNALVAALDAEAVNSAVKGFSAAADDARKILADVDKVTAPLSQRSADINQIVTDAQQLTARLNAASAKVSGVLDQIDGFFGSGATDGLVAEARQTLQAFRQTANRFDAQFAYITRSITGFTKRGLGDTQGLINDARRSLGNLDRVITNLGNNPSSIITGRGGSAVRESRGGRPRR
ncbi:MAG: MlaD family protein [Pseudomonadota bacterium]